MIAMEQDGHRNNNGAIQFHIHMIKLNKKNMLRNHISRNINFETPLRFMSVRLCLEELGIYDIHKFLHIF